MDGIMNKIKLLRMNKGLKQWQLAFEVGVSKNHISRLERGEQKGAIKTLQKIAKVLGVHVGELID
jgi:transcriptional regulator with XRE-family HTH domain